MDEARGRIGRLTLGAWAATVVLVGCAAVGVIGRRELPTWCPSGECSGVPADFPRTATLQARGDCVMVLIDGTQASALWPPHYTATYGPLVVYDATGQRVAREGDRLRTVILGPTPIDLDSCGLRSQVQLFFDPYFAGPSAASGS